MEEIENLEFEIIALKDRVESLTEGVGTVEEKVDELTKQLNLTNSKVDSLQDSLTHEFKGLNMGLVFTYLTVLAWLLLN